MAFLEEAMNDFFRNQTFFIAAKKYKPELKKQILSFLQRKGITGIKGDYSFQNNYDLSDALKQDKKTKKGIFNGVLDKMEFGKEFFSAKKEYDAKFSLPVFTYKDYDIKIEIKSNEEFFETGHDLEVSLTPTNSNEYSDKKILNYKLNILEDIDKVLNNIWIHVEDAITNYASIEKPVYKPSDRVYVESEIRGIVDKYLNKYYNVLKSGKRSEITDDAKKPATFYAVTSSGDNRKYSSFGRGKPSFELKFRLRQLEKNLEKSRYSDDKVSTEISKMFPDYAKWIEIYNEGYVAKGGRSYDGLNARKLFGEKTYGDEHLKILARLKLVCERFLKLGYVPVKGNVPYNAREDCTIEFIYSDKVKEQAKDPTVIARFFNGQKYKDYVEKTFFYQGEDIRRTPEKLIKMVFTNIGK